MAISSLIYSIVSLALSITPAAAAVLPRSGTTSESITYVLPIWEGSLANHTRDDDVAVLSDMKSQLGLGGRYTKLGWSFSSWALSRDISGSDQDYNFDPTNLNYMLGLGVTAALPILVHMNDGRWADCCTPNSSGGWGDSLLDYIAGQPNTTVLSNTGASEFGPNFGSNYFTLSRLNTVYRNYKKRNVQASAQIIAAWAADNPSLFAGVSLDSETIMPNSESDYNPLAIDEWKQWLQNTGIYGPSGDYFGAGRNPAFASIGDFNTATGQNFASWDAMQPPQSITPGDLFSEEWERWRVMMIVHSVSDETLWIAQAGIDRTLIYGHQTPRMDDYGFADDVYTFTAANGASGITTYGRAPSDYGSVDNPMRGAGKNNFGIFELNPLTTDATVSYTTLVTLFNDGIKIICPNSWESDEANPDQYALFNSPTTGDTFGTAVNQFLSDYGNTERNIQPEPWNPGTLVFDLFDQFSSATSTGQDNHVEAAGSVGNVIRKSVYSAVPGVISYTITLPAVSSGQRLNFWTSIGIKDGAGVGGETQFQVTINGSNLFGQYYHFHQNYWVWKRWVPLMVDITAWAGSTVTLELLTTGNETWGWTTWGSPAIYQTTTDQNNLAQGASVSTSSSDGAAGVWDPSFLVDGNVDGGVDGRNGWSSSALQSATANEWAQIDLTTSQSFGKVVLFPRSDLVDYAGTGFPSSFVIQGSNDANSWTALVTEQDYPDVKAGEGQIFTFPSATFRYVRVLATTLRGIGTESDYRFQLAEIQIY
jgi:hypothetical protein